MNKIIPFFQISRIPYLAIAQRLGYPSWENIGIREKEMITENIELTLSHWNPKASYRHLSILEIQENAIVCDALSIPGKNIQKYFGKIEKISLFAVTIGEKMIKFIEQFQQKGELTRLALLDAVLSELCEQVAEETQNIIRKEAYFSGYTLTPRYSPGYGDLPLSFQKQLLQAVKGEQIGIQLTDSFMMIPEKSITAITGWKKKT